MARCALSVGGAVGVPGDGRGGGLSRGGALRRLRPHAVRRGAESIHDLDAGAGYASRRLLTRTSASAATAVISMPISATVAGAPMTAAIAPAAKLPAGTSPTLSM